MAGTRGQQGLFAERRSVSGNSLKLICPRNQQQLVTIALSGDKHKKRARAYCTGGPSLRQRLVPMNRREPIPVQTEGMHVYKLEWDQQKLCKVLVRAAMKEGDHGMVARDVRGRGNGNGLQSGLHKKLYLS